MNLLRKLSILSETPWLARCGILGLSLGLPHLLACRVANQYIKKFGGDTPNTVYQDVPGKNYADYLAPSLRDTSMNITAILESLTAEESGQANASLYAQHLLDSNEDVQKVSTTSAKLMVASQHAKVNYSSTDYLQDDESFFTKSAATSLTDPDYSHDKVTWTATGDSFTVSVAEKIPVKNQGQRGTCASFAGVGQIEGFLIKKYGISGIDLSEQRFYFMSKPDNWASGGDKTKGGSDSGTGFAKSAGYNYQGVTYPPGSPTDYNLPLESDCGYNSQLGSNDLQTPQAKGCETGVAKVQDFAAWVYQWDARVGTAQEIYDTLLAKDFPIVIATKLSSNWENNDGLVTLAGAGGATGATSHASGHAYLIVGAKKLDESKFPGEGGMCFIVKNSWGTGWGSHGYSCITLAWFNKWRFSTPFPIVKDVVLDTSKFADAKKNVDNKPDGLKDPDNANGTSANKRASGQKGTASVSSSGFFMSADDYTLGAIRSDNDEYRKMLYKTTTSTITLRGLLADGVSTTRDLDLAFDGSKYISFAEEGSEAVKVGELDATNKTIILCSQDYSAVCKLNYVSDTNELAIGYTREQVEHEDSVGPYDWKSLALGSYGLDFNFPSVTSSKVDMRLKDGETTTNPLRFSVDPAAGNISYLGNVIGNYQNVSLCSGDYQSVCRIILSGDNFNVLMKAKQ